MKITYHKTQAQQNAYWYGKKAPRGTGLLTNKKSTLKPLQIMVPIIMLALFFAGMIVTEAFACDVEFTITNTTTSHTCALLGYPHN